MKSFSSITTYVYYMCDFRYGVPIDDSAVKMVSLVLIFYFYEHYA